MAKTVSILPNPGLPVLSHRGKLILPRSSRGWKVSRQCRRASRRRASLQTLLIKAPPANHEVLLLLGEKRLHAMGANICFWGRGPARLKGSIPACATQLTARPPVALGFGQFCPMQRLGTTFSLHVRFRPYQPTGKRGRTG